MTLDLATYLMWTPDICLIVNPHYDIIDVSHALELATSTKRFDIIGRNLFDVFPDNPDTLKPTGSKNVKYALEQVLKTKKNYTLAVQKYDIQTSSAKESGFEERYWSIVSAPILNAKNEVAFFLIRSDDVTQYVVSKNENDSINRTKSEANVFSRTQEIQEINKKLSESEARLADIARNIQLIYTVTSIASDAIDLQKLMQTCLNLICETINWPVGHILYPQNKQDSFLESSHIWYLKDKKKSHTFKEVTEATHFKKGKGLPGRIWASGEPAWIVNVYKDDNFLRAQQSREIGVRGAVGFPIIVNKKIMAIFEFFCFESKECDYGLLQAFEVMGQQIGRIFERKNIESRLKDSEEKFRMLYDSSSDAIMTLEPPDWRFTDGNPAAIKLFNVKDKNEFISISPWHLSPERQPDGELSSEKAMQMINNAMESGSIFFEWVHKKYKGEDFFATVLLTKLKLKGKNLLQATVRDISDIKNAQEALRKSNEKLLAQKVEIEFISYHDYLTGLPNRRYFEELAHIALVKAKRDKKMLALLLIDLDLFKIVNDTLGHEAGDLALKETASRLSKFSRGNDAVARLGGDEFIMIIDQIENADSAKIIAERIIENMRKPFQLNEHTITLSASIGIAVFTGNGETVAQLMKCADQALYKAKDLGKDRFSY